MNVVTRFPPSPTGYFHIGSARTALFNYLFAQHQGGVMYFRFEDTDRERSKKEYEDDIIASLEWLGIPYTLPEISHQSERMPVYQKHFKTLLEKGIAYEAEASTDNPKKKVIRFRNPNVTITFQDLVRGGVTFHTAELGDFVIARSIDEPLYHLAVVIDDHEMGVTHVIRGEDHLSNTPRQILILEALGFTRPIYAHMPLILAPDRTKLSKRHGAVSINEYRASGYLAPAIINYLALLGWNPGGDEELFSLKELVERFDMVQVQKSGAIFDIEKLKWFNRHYLMKMSDEEFASYVCEPLKESLEKRSITVVEEIVSKLLPIIRERISISADIAAMAADGEFDYYFADPPIDPAKLPAKNESTDDVRRHLLYLKEQFTSFTLETFTDSEKIKVALWEYATKNGRGNVLWPLRYALTGREKSPDPFIVASIIGADAVVRRIDAAVEVL